MIAHQEAGRIVKRSVLVAGHKTSVSLENAFWLALKDAAARRGRTVNQMVTEIDRARGGNLSSAIRVFLLQDGRGEPRPFSARVPSADPSQGMDPVQRA